MKNGFNSSQRMAAVQMPIIPIIGDLIKANPGTISLAQGVVYYPPPAAAIDQIQLFMSNLNNHRYGPVEGLPDLISLIKDKLHHENGITSDLSNRIIVTAGANMAFLNAMFAVTDPGDEVILPTPYYFNQEMAIRMVSCTPVLVKSDDQFQLSPDAVLAAITPRTRAIVTVSPNNPAGVVYPAAILETINRLCLEHGIYHICDEAYEYFTYDQIRHFSPASLTDAHNHTISMYSLSKAYGFASWRIGYMVIPEHLYLPVLKAQDTNLICASAIAQYAAIGALGFGRSYTAVGLSKISETRMILLEELKAVSKFCSFPQPDGAFYFLLKIDTPLSSITLATKLIEEYKVAVIPGNAFGLDQGCYLRVSYGSLEPETAIEGIHRLIKGLMAICYNKLV